MVSVCDLILKKQRGIGGVGEDKEIDSESKQ